MTAYYNEIDPYAAQWLRNLIDAGLIAKGDVDERDIREVRPQDLTGYTQCHFFAGIGGWSYALRLAGWPDDRPVWTGSCPCQPFSTAGKTRGFADERHLWPAWHWLIQQCMPPDIFGEQSASKAAEHWLDLVQADVEALGYSLGCVALPAACVGAPHKRERIYWVAYADSERQCREHSLLQQREPNKDCAEAPRSGTRPCYWSSGKWEAGADRKVRWIEPGVKPMAHGVQQRVEQLRAFGNAIVPQVAAEFIRAYMEI